MKQDNHTYLWYCEGVFSINQQLGVWWMARVGLEKKVCLPLEGAMEKFLLGKGGAIIKGQKTGLFPTVGYKMFFIIEGAQVFPFLSF